MRNANVFNVMWQTHAVVENGDCQVWASLRLAILHRRLTSFGQSGALPRDFPLAERSLSTIIHKKRKARKSFSYFASVANDDKRKLSG